MLTILVSPCCSYECPNDMVVSKVCILYVVYGGHCLFWGSGVSHRDVTNELGSTHFRDSLGGWAKNYVADIAMSSSYRYSCRVLAPLWIGARVGKSPWGSKIK